jgi:prepilin-type N-terminal cleavage/methylation domain-containing protein
MLIRFKHSNRRNGDDAFTLVEVLMAIAILAMVMTGLLYGYVQANRMAEYSSLSLAAQSYASQGAEQSRSAQWNSQMWPITNGPDTGDERPPTTNSSGAVTSIVQVATLDIPTIGQPTSSNFAFWVTNYIQVTQISFNPPLRQIRSDAVWTFALTQQKYTNTVIILRAPDE